jgi:general secretion pathway protein H
MVALVPVALDRLRESVQYRDTVRAVVTDLRAARQKALAEGVEVRFLVDLANARFGLDGRTPHDLPPPLQMRVTVAGIEWSERQVGAIRFLPQGGATGGSVDVLRPRGGGVRITVDWLSASVSQTPIVP